MKILLFGGAGQLGKEILAHAENLSFTIVSPVLEEVDIVDQGQVERLTRAVAPAVVINCAAYTSVDKAEDEPEIAYRANRDGAGHVAEAARAIGARIIHISTDYVFGDASQLSNRGPLDERTPTDPLNVYGKSKLEGELRVLQIGKNSATVLRTAWLHGARGPNFLHTMMKLFREKEEVRVVNDQFGSPTWTGWLAEVILDCARIETSGLLHAACGGSTSWFGFAQAILEEMKIRGEKVRVERLLPQTTAEAARKAVRPGYSALNSTKLSIVLGRESMDWREGVRAHMAELGEVGQ